MSKISMDSKKEKALINKAKQDKKAFGAIYKHYKKHIFKFFNVKLRNKEVSEELTSVVFEKALKGIDNFKWQGVSFSAWLYRIANNTLVDYFRKQAKTKEKEIDIEDMKILASKTPTPEEVYESNYADRVLYEILSTLPTREKDIIYMKFFEGYSNKTIAELTQLSETNIGTIVYRTLKKMRDQYSSIES